jgi:hypothetical protein
MHPISHTFKWSKGINQSPKHGMHTKNPSNCSGSLCNGFCPFVPPTKKKKKKKKKKTYTQIVGDYVQIKNLTF